MRLFCILLLLTLLFSCKRKGETNQIISKTEKTNVQEKKFNIIQPTNFDTVRIGSTIDFSITVLDTVDKIDSVILLFEGNRMFSGRENNFSSPLNPEKVGNCNIGIDVYFDDGNSQRKNITLYFLADIEPAILDFKVVDRFPHSTDNFTEGLLFHEDYLYEGTGDWGKSALYKTNIKTGEIVKSSFLPSNIFGEGIAILNNKIIQLTYKSQEGYVYDKESFALIKKFPYSISTEGWGLTTDGKDLIMSNGTDRLYVLDSTYYSLIKEIQVCDNKEPLDSINELEYVNGYIYANIWMDNRIVKIDYSTGKVVAYIDLSTIVPKQYLNHHSNVLNGIAQNPENGTLLVTGKKWDKIFEIKIE